MLASLLLIKAQIQDLCDQTNMEDVTVSRLLTTNTQTRLCFPPESSQTDPQPPSPSNLSHFLLLCLWHPTLIRKKHTFKGSLH